MPIALPTRQASRRGWCRRSALRGRYHDTVTWPDGTKPNHYDWVVRTDCLRTGDRCMSFFHAPPDASKPLVFSSRSWLMSTVLDGICSAGRAPVNNTAEFPLPQPPQNPIVLLTGHGHHEQTGPAPTAQASTKVRAHRRLVAPLAAHTPTPGGQSGGAGGQTRALTSQLLVQRQSRWTMRAMSHARRGGDIGMMRLVASSRRCGRQPIAVRLR